MESFIDFVTDSLIIDCVCRKRASEAAKRHGQHHFHAISSDYRISNPSHIVYELTPPRRQWIHVGERGRTAPLLGGIKQTIPTAERTYRSVLWTVLRDKKNGVQSPYLRKLNSFIEEVKQRIQAPDYAIKTPRTIPIFKKKGNPDVYRPICLFEDLADSIIIILANRYLSRLFDVYFYEDSLAFRPKRYFHGKRITTFHHEAIALISQYLERNNSRNVYVAECDMQKFYDTVDHSIVRYEYNWLIEKARTDNPGVSFDDITRVFYSYLDCYTFTDNVWKKNHEPEYWAQHHIQRGEFGWVKDYQKLAESNETKMPQLGVPQGGALSGLIANIVINRVDECMKHRLHPENDLYVRYCDDMLLLSTNKKRCRRLFRLYTRQIKDARLIPHPPITPSFGTGEYWDTKSKTVYKWISEGKESGSKWIGFVGYEMSRDGSIRIRKNSLRKEKRKQKRVVSELFNLTYQKNRVNNSSMELSYRNTMISMAVGRATLWNYTTLKNEFCWANGFRMLNDNPVATTQIRDLDRCRNRIIHRANERLKRLVSTVEGTIAKEGNNKRNSKMESSLTFYGKPFSYYYHYKKNCH